MSKSEYRLMRCTTPAQAAEWMNEQHDSGYELAAMVSHGLLLVVMRLRDPAKASPIVPKTEQEHTAMTKAVGIAVDLVQKSQT